MHEILKIVIGGNTLERTQTGDWFAQFRLEL